MTWGKSKTKVKDFTPKAWKAHRGRIGTDITRAAHGEGPATEAYGGELVAGITGQETGHLSNIADMANTDYRDQQGADYLRGNLAGNELDFYNDPAFQQMLDFAGRRFLSGFGEQEEAQKALFARAGQQVQNSSPFSEARSRISEAKSSGLADVAAQLIGKQYGAAKDRQFQSAEQLSNLETQRQSRAREALEAASLPRLIKDMGLERGREEFGRRQEAIMKALGLELEMASPHLAGQTKQSNVGIL